MDSYDYSLLIHELLSSALSIDAFSALFPHGQRRCSKELISLLDQACSKKDSSEVEYLLIAIDLDGVTSAYTPMLCRLLNEKWHYKHEDIVMLLEKLSDPSSIEPIIQVISHKSRFDTNFHLVRKCIWALGAIGTDSAIEELRVLAESKIDVVKDAASAQLDALK